MRFAFIAKHRGAWQISELCEALGVSRGGFYLSGSSVRRVGDRKRTTSCWRMFVRALSAVIAHTVVRASGTTFGLWTLHVVSTALHV